jgi:hypothetical protein
MTKGLGITFPRDGDILNRHDGTESNENLVVAVRGTAPSGAKVLVNGQETQANGPTFTFKIALTGRKSVIVAEAGGARDEVRVWWNKGSRKRFRFSMDDNILFLKDLGLNPHKYASIFDHWYLGFLREMHAEFGTKVHINIYYQTDGFDLTQMPDKWKDEWQANAPWLHLSFHALGDKPDRPYRNAVYTQMAHDYDLICGHIRRFAGDEVLSNTTTVHWAECPMDAARALRDRGIENLIGLFSSANPECTTRYYLTPEQNAHCDGRDAWHDHDTDLTFIQCACVVNGFEVEEIGPLLEARTAIPQTSDMIELLIHEQYFREELSYYQPTVKEKVRTALRWVTDHGYEPVFWSDGFLGEQKKGRTTN